MDFPVFLAITPTQFAQFPCHSSHIAWMGCSFSPNHNGLCNLPSQLPQDSALILTDETPPNGHDAQRIACELQQIAGDLKCVAVVLDLQRCNNTETERIVDEILASLSCPVIVSESYAAGRQCGVLASPPLWTPLQAALRPWKGRPVWLELAEESAMVTVTKDGSTLTPCTTFPEDPVFYDDILKLNYKTQLQPGQFLVHLHRSSACLEAYKSLAAQLGVTAMLSLWNVP